MSAARTPGPDGCPVNTRPAGDTAGELNGVFAYIGDRCVADKVTHPIGDRG